MNRVNSQSESLDLTERKSPTKSNNPLIIGASTDDVLAMLQTGLLLDPRLVSDAIYTPKQFKFSPLPVFQNCVESWFERDVEKRKTPGNPVALVIEESGVVDGTEMERGPLALPAALVNEVIFRNSVEHDRFRDLLLQFRLDSKIEHIKIRVDSEKFGSETEVARTEPSEISPERLTYVHRVFRVTSAIAVSIAARRDKRSTDHTVRLLKGLVASSPRHEQDNDTPLLDGVLNHRTSKSTLSKGSVEQLIVTWSDLILNDSFAAPMSLSVLLDRMENLLVSDTSFEEFIDEAKVRFVEIRDVLDGRRAMVPFSIDPKTTPFTRVLDALQLLVMRRSPMDLLEMPRIEHMASVGVFMLAAYWSGLSTLRTLLIQGIATEPLLDVLVDLEVNAIKHGGPKFPLVAGTYRVEVDQSPGGQPFKYLINGIQAAFPKGSSWRVDVSPQSNVQAQLSLRPSSTPRSDREVARYSLKTHELEIRNDEIVITQKDS